MRERFNVNKIEVVVAISFLIVGILLYVLTDNFLGLGWLCCLICIVYFFVDVPFSWYYYKKLQKQRKDKEKPKPCIAQIKIIVGFYIIRVKQSCKPKL